MAVNRLVIDGYGQLEINNCAFRRDGRVEAQCKPDATAFSSVPVENGMILAVDAAARVVKPATDTSLPVAIVYTAEHLYDERADGLKDFYTKATNDFLPRLGYLAVGDKFTTNTICYDTAVYANESALKSAIASAAVTPVYGAVHSNGAIAVVSAAPSVGLKLRVLKGYTMPDGQYGVQFQVYAD